MRIRVHVTIKCFTLILFGLASLSGGSNSSRKSPISRIEIYPVALESCFSLEKEKIEHYVEESTEQYLSVNHFSCSTIFRSRCQSHLVLDQCSPLLLPVNIKNRELVSWCKKSSHLSSNKYCSKRCAHFFKGAYLREVFKDDSNVHVDDDEEDDDEV